LLKRYDRAHFMDTKAEEATTEIWTQINDGFVSFDDDLAPKTETKQYVADKSEHDVILSYKPSYKYNMELDTDDDVNKKLYEIGADQLVGKTCDILSVDMWDGTLNGTQQMEYIARKGEYNVIPSKAGSGDPGGFIKVEGTLAQVGDLIKGKWNTVTKAFTANA